MIEVTKEMRRAFADAAGWPPAPWMFGPDVERGIAAVLALAKREMTCYVVTDSPKMLRETLCVAQTRIGNSDLDGDRKQEHIARLQRLADECDRHRPLGPDGKHGDRHTPTCGCDTTGSTR